MGAKALNCLQINLHHAKSASATLSKRLFGDSINVALIQEPWIAGGKIRGLPKSICKLVYDFNNDAPRAAILFKNHVNFLPIPEFISRDLVAASVEVKEKKELIIASAYFPGEDAVSPPVAVQQLVHYCKKKNLQYIIACDANAHHTVWGSSDINNKGESLLEFLSSNSVFIANRGSEPTFIKERGS